MHKILLIIVTAIPFIALSLLICKAIIKKKQNKLNFTNIISIAFLSLFIMFPIISYFIGTDGLLFFMVMIIEYYILSILIPWSAFFVIALFVIKKLILNPTRAKTVWCVIFILLLMIIICVCTFSGVFIDVMNWIIGGPTIQ